MKRIHTIIIGAGQAGLAVSRSLTDQGIDHLLIERGRVAQRWEERWDSLRLLSPNWMTRLPGWRYSGPDPDGFMSKNEVISFLRSYARSFRAPVLEETVVHDVRQAGDEWHVSTDRGTWQAQNVVIATGHCDVPNVPRCSADVPSHIVQTTSIAYRNPDQLPSGGVLVVGASASGVQLARELAQSGRQVILSVGRHRRVPRRYRGHDIYHWLDRIGALERPLSSVSDPEAAMREPSSQLVGNDKGTNADLAQLASEGIRLTGRLAGFEESRARFAADLPHTTADADRQLSSLLSRIEEHIATHGLNSALPPAESVAPVPVTGAPLEVDLRSKGIRSILWATGYKRSYAWLRADVLDSRGEIRQQRGRTSAQGLYVLGLQFMIRRNSSFIDGVGRDALEVAAQIGGRAERASREAA
jgi:putative flavoprotein involved in K+ transport